MLRIQADQTGSVKRLRGRQCEQQGELTLYLEVNFSTAIRLDALLNYVDLQDKKGEIVKRLRDEFKIA